MLRRRECNCPFISHHLRDKILPGQAEHILENIIYFELLRRGYDVAIGKPDSKEVDFIATKTDEKKYIQVTESMNAPETRERELSPLRKIPNNYEKIVIAME